MIWYIRDNKSTIYTYDDVWIQIKGNNPYEALWNNAVWHEKPVFLNGRKPDILLPLDAFIEIL